MNILMFTNTFTPHVGGVARSVEQFTAEFRRRGHSVLVVAPEFPDHVDTEENIIRIPAIQRFNGRDFSVAVPIHGPLKSDINKFAPQIVHSHHPFILGDTAVRVSGRLGLPLVFTHHTQYEKYTHYVPGDSPLMNRFAVELAVGYCNLCDSVIAPSETIRATLIEQGVKTPVVEIPTGVDVDLFGGGDAAAARHERRIPADRFVVGHVGRLAPEKGLEFLANAVARFVSEHENACFLVAGSGPCESMIQRVFAERNSSDRLIMVGQLDRHELANFYAALDVFAFASQSETQGMVLTEAMAAGTPVVAVDAPGVREVLRSWVNGIGVAEENTDVFVETLHVFARSSPKRRTELVAAARQTAEEFSIERTGTQSLELYDRLITSGATAPADTDAWSKAQRRIEKEWQLWSNVADAMTQALG